MKRFNLSEIALHHQQFMFFLMILVFLAGVVSYIQLGRAEDPSYTVRSMVVSAAWPGATAKQVEEQVTDKLEKKLQETPGVDYIKSYSRPGKATIFVNLNDDVRVADIKPTWVKVRNLVKDMQDTLPQGVVGPYFNDDYGDTFGSIYALTGNGFSYAELKDEADKIRQTILTIPDVGKVEILGNQPEKIYIDANNGKLASLSIDPRLIINNLVSQNAMQPAGRVETGTDNVYLRVSGIFENLDNVKNTGIRANNRLFRLADIAQVYRGYSDPPQPKMYFNGNPCIGIAVSMRDGGDILGLGNSLQSSVGILRSRLPQGMEFHQVSDQPKVVKASIGEFVETLLLAIIIVLAVNFLSLGRRAGTVVALSIPLVLCATFVVMKIMDINLHKTSLGALIIALGLLVDDAIIAVEMMEVKLEEGWDKLAAASHAYNVTSLPMLIGTLITIAGFMPVGFSKGIAAEYVAAIFSVVTVTLIISWIVSVTVVPLLGVHFLKSRPAGSHERPQSRHAAKARQVLVWVLHRRWLVIGTTLAVFVCSLFANRFVVQEFFPPSTRPELIVDITLPEGSSFQSTDREVQRFTTLIADEPGLINISSYVGVSAPRFVLVFDTNLGADNFGQLVILTKDAEARNALRDTISTDIAPQFDSARIRSRVLSVGPPAAFPVMFRVSGASHDQVRGIAELVRDHLRGDRAITEVVLDWYEKNKVMRLDVDQDKARILGIDSETLAVSLQTSLSGLAVTEFREGDKTISIVVRTGWLDRNNLAQIGDLNIHVGNGRYVPLDQIARIRYEAENGLIWRRGLQPTIAVQADVIPGVTGNDVTARIDKELAAIRQSLPPGYTVTAAGGSEDSAKSQRNLLAVIPAMIVVIMVLLMWQLQHMGKMFIVLLTAPLGIIGVNLFLILLHRPMGFVALLGVIALAGMIMRNSVILLDQIEKHRQAGQPAYDAIIDSTILRFRPIMLTAAAAILGMIPLMTSSFWGPMAVAIMGGLLVATVLTLIFVPAVYAAAFRVKPLA